MALSRKIRERIEQIEAERADRLPEGAEHYANTLRDALGVQGSKDDRSSPGEAPRRQTGTLQGSIIEPIVDVPAGRAWIGTDSEYGEHLLKTRPYLRITMDRCREHLRWLFSARR